MPPKPISRVGDSSARSAHLRVVFNKYRGVRSPAASAISEASAAMASVDFRNASALRLSTWRGCSGTNCLAASRISAIGPSSRSRMRTALVNTASRSWSRAKIKDLAACGVDRGPLPAIKWETISMA